MDGIDVKMCKIQLTNLQITNIIISLESYMIDMNCPTVEAKLNRIIKSLRHQRGY